MAAVEEAVSMVAAVSTVAAVEVVFTVAEAGVTPILVAAGIRTGVPEDRRHIHFQGRA